MLLECSCLKLIYPEFPHSLAYRALCRTNTRKKLQIKFEHECENIFPKIYFQKYANKRIA